MTRSLIDTFKRVLKDSPKPKGHRVQPVRQSLDEEAIYRKTDKIRGVATKGGLKLTMRRLDDV